MTSRNWTTILLDVLIAVVFCADVFAEDDEELSKKLANPIASIISISDGISGDRHHLMHYPAGHQTSSLSKFSTNCPICTPR